MKSIIAACFFVASLFVGIIFFIFRETSEKIANKLQEGYVTSINCEIENGEEVIRAKVGGFVNNSEVYRSVKLDHWPDDIWLRDRVKIVPHYDQYFLLEKVKYKLSWGAISLEKSDE